MISRVQDRLLYSQIPTRVQNKACCGIADAVARAIQIIKDLFNRLCSCGSKQTPQLAALTPRLEIIAPRNPEQRPVLVENAAPPAEIIPPPQPVDGRAYVDLTRVVQRPYTQEEMDRNEPHKRGLDIVDVNMNLVMQDIWYQRNQRVIEQQNALPHEERSEAAIFQALFGLETARASFESWQERRAQLQAAVLPQEFWDRMDGMRGAEVVAEEIALVRRANRNRIEQYPQLEGEARRLAGLEIDTAYAALRELKARHHAFNNLPNELGENPLYDNSDNIPADEYGLAPLTPEERAGIQEDLQQELLEFSDYSHFDVNSNIAKLRKELTWLPEGLNELQLKRFRYLKETRDARLAGLAARRDHLRAIVLPGAFWDRLDLMSFDEVVEQNLRNAGRNEELLGQIYQSEENGEQARLQDELDQGYVMKLAYEDRVQAIYHARPLIEAHNPG